MKLLRNLSLELKLPLLMSVVLATVLLLAVGATYTTLQSSALAAARQRLDRATRQLATISSTAVFAQQARYRDAGAKPEIRRALARGDSASGAAARAVLATLSQPTDSGMPVELWSATGRKVAFVGNEVGVSMREDLRAELPERISLALRNDPPPLSDSIRVGPLYVEGSRIHLWFVTPILEQQRVIGFITHQRRVAIGQQTQATLRELSGDSVSLYYRNVDGTTWSTRTSVSQPPHERVDSASGRATADGKGVLYHEERIANTPLIVGMSIPERAILAPIQGTVRRLSWVAIALLAVGVMLAWLIGRSVARPLGRITDAVSSLAAGDYRTRVPDTGDVEIRRLARSFNHMASELGASRSALQKQTDEARAASNAKSEFLTTMSHELRTPLNAIGGYAELLEMGLRGPVTEEQRRDLARIKTSQEHLLGLISSVLDLSRIEAGRIKYQMTDVALEPFLGGLDALIGPQAAANSIRLERVPVDPRLAVVADREKLRQILLNLLSNAIRHASAGGSVTISAEPRGSTAAIIVEDSGPGVPPDKREVIFEPFVQLDRSLTQSREGLGLGLAISRDLARGMSGDLTAEGRIGGGGRFVLVLPRGTIEPGAQLPVSGEVPASPAANRE